MTSAIAKAGFSGGNLEPIHLCLHSRIDNAAWSTSMVSPPRPDCGVARPPGRNHFATVCQAASAVASSITWNIFGGILEMGVDVPFRREKGINRSIGGSQFLLNAS